MPAAPFPADEADRLQALQALELLDTPPEQAFEDLVKLASQICGVPISLISLLDSDRQWFKAKTGLEARETPREMAFCGYAIHGEDILEVHDAREDPRFQDNPLVRSDPNIRFYAGMPLSTSDGHKLGTLCVIDNKPNALSASQRFALQTLAQQVMTQIELRMAVRRIQDTLGEVEQKRERLEELRDIQDRLLSVLAHDLRNAFYSLEGLLDLLAEEEMEPEEQANLIQVMRQSLNAVRSLFDELLAWANGRIKGPEEVAPQPVYQMAQKELARLKDAAKKKDVFLDNQLPPTLHAAISPDRLGFVFRNLTQNAIKFTGNGTVKLSWVEQPAGGTLVIQDSGCGMSSLQLNKLFDWELKSSSPGTAGEQGSGVGLLLCRDFVNEWGGRIWAESEEGEGSTFSVFIPRHLLSSESAIA